MTQLTTNRRRLALAALAVTVLVSLAQATTQNPAVAQGGPSVPLPNTASVPVTKQTMTPRGPDETTTRALRGEQGTANSKPGGGNYSATSLTPSATWDVSQQTGDFNWSYPLRVPPAPGGLQPTLALSYSSSAVDGLTSAVNTQASWAGDGFGLWPGYVERTYASCVDDITTGKKEERPADFCWRSDNATLSLGENSSELIRDDANGDWRSKQDDGSRIEKKFSAGNGAHEGEHWKVTTTDGTQYFFGSRPEAGSTWTAPVFGDDAGEPCHKASFADSSCTQGYRWNLDKVVDRNGNMMLFSYERELNKYGKNKNASVAEYVRGGWLRQIDYGLRDDRQLEPTGRVLFETGDRCVPGSTCTLAKPDNWVDVPLKLRCDAATCKDQWAPSFWTTKRLAKVVTQVRRDTGFTDVDSWTLRHEFPDPGDGEKPALWLKGITHTGHVGEAISLPEVTFEGVRKPNRVVQPNDGHASLIRFRMNAIVSESGGVTSIDYTEPDCGPGNVPANPETNTRRCYPVRWAAPFSEERTDWFHKYVVESVSNLDRLGNSPADVTAYRYLDGAAWHHTTSEFADEKHRTWNEFRGFGRVQVLKGTGGDGPKSLTETRYYRGMHGDKMPNNATRPADVTDSEGGKVPDEDWLRGQVRESTTFNGEGGPVVTKTITEPTWQGPTATRGDRKAYIVRTGVTRTYTAVEGGTRQVRSETAYDDRGVQTQVNDLGDLATAADDKCTRTTIVRNLDRWLLALPSKVVISSVHCGVQAPDKLLADTRTSYDGKAFGEAPDAGNQTEVEELTETGHVTTLTSQYDVHGRSLASLDALGRRTSTAYTPAVGGPVTRAVTTDNAGHQTTNDFEVASGQAVKVTDANGRVTESVYDALGRTKETWLPNRKRADGNQANFQYSYLVRTDGPTVVGTTKLGPNGNYITTHTLLDGLLRQKQTQAPAMGGGRLLTNTRYDSQGRPHEQTQPFYHDGQIDTNLWSASLAAVPGTVVTRYDGANRAVEEIFKAGEDEKWRTTTTYGGDRVTVTPQSGGITTTTITDARGLTTELRQHKSATEYDATKYTHSPAGHLESATDPAGNVWRYVHDLRGNKVRAEDPDKGITTFTYNNAGELVTSTDSRGVTLVREYDALGRKSVLRKDSPTGTKLAEWAYDSVPSGKGLPASATRWVDGNAYVSRVLGYNSLYQEIKKEIVIPAVEGALAGSYVAQVGYNPNGSPRSDVYPAVGQLPTETVTHSFGDLAEPLGTSGGFNGSTTEYVTDTRHTRYGEKQRVQLGTGTKRAWLSYYYDDHSRRLNRIIVDAEVPKPMQADLHFRYDDYGNVKSISDTPLGQPADVQCFRNDHLRRLVDAWTPEGGCDTEPAAARLGGAAPYWQTFSYDKTGNRVTAGEHDESGLTKHTYTYNGTGHALRTVSTVKPNGSTALDQFGYDKAGNTVRRNLAGTEQTLDWNAEGHLTKVVEGGKETSFLYDSDGGRLIRRDPERTTLYLGNQEVHLAKDGTKTATRYYWHAGELVAVRDGSGLSWLAVDHQDTSQLAIDADTLEVAKRRQKPFGEPRGGEVVFPGEKGFVGGTVDDSIGLTTLGARQYDAAQGRFLSVDSLINHMDPQQSHGYTYSNNNPATLSDPSGLAPEDKDGYCVGWRGDCGIDPVAGADINGRYTDEQLARRGVLRRQIGPRTVYPNGTVHRKHNGVDHVNGLPVRRIKHLARLLAIADRLVPHHKKQRFLQDDLDAFETSLLLQSACWSSRAEDICDYDARSELVSLHMGMLVEDDPSIVLGGGRGPGGAGGRRGGVRMCPGNSFAPDTFVLMADGTRKPLASVVVGDEVLATDPETGESGPRRVVATIVGDGLVKNVVELITGTGVVVATDNHEFWSPSRDAWVPAAGLRAGDTLRMPSGETLALHGVAPRTRLGVVRNLTVEGIHSYYVDFGGSPALVHNAKGGRGGGHTGNGDDIQLDKKHTARLDQFDERGQASFEIHIYRKGTEIGFFRSDGYFSKHGLKAGDMSLPKDAEITLTNIAIDFLQRSGRIKPGDNIEGNNWMRPHLGKASRGGC